MIDVAAIWAAPLVQAVLAGCMVLVAVLCIRLDRRLAALREGRDGVAATAAALAAAVARAEAAVLALKSATDGASEDLDRRNRELERQIGEARAAGEALGFLVTTARALEPGARSGVASGAQSLPPTRGPAGLDRDGPHAARNLTPQDLIAPDLTRQDLTRQDLTGQDLAARAARQAARWSGLR